MVAVRLAYVAAQAEQAAQRYQSMQQQVAEISVSHTSADGAITVTVAASGSVTGLSLSDRVGRLGPDDLATKILDCIRRAQSMLGGQVQAVMTATVGDDVETVRAVVSSYAARFPGPAEGAAPARYRRVDDDEDDWSDRPVLDNGAWR